MITRFTKILKLLREEIKEWFENFLIKNPPGRTGKLLRRLYWSKRFHKHPLSLSISGGCTITSPENIYVGEKVNIMQNCSLYAIGNGFIKIGDRVSINSNVILGGAEDGEIIIGSDVLIGPNVVIRASNHKYLQKDIPIKQQGHTGGKIIIGDDVWIGANVVILPNVTIGGGAVIGAGAVVNRDIPSHSLAAGVPAKIIKEDCRN